MDVIKTYVREGLGIGIIARLAYQPERDDDLGMKDLGHLFPWETTKIAYARGKYLRRFQQEFVDIFLSDIQSGHANPSLEACNPPEL